MPARRRLTSARIASAVPPICAAASRPLAWSNRAISARRAASPKARRYWRQDVRLCSSSLISVVGSKDRTGPDRREELDRPALTSPAEEPWTTKDQTEPTLFHLRFFTAYCLPPTAYCEALPTAYSKGPGDHRPRQGVGPGRSASVLPLGSPGPCRGRRASCDGLPRSGS